MLAPLIQMHSFISGYMHSLNTGCSNRLIAM